MTPMHIRYILLCRHGETAWSRSGHYTSFTDLPLTPLGKQQARLLGKQLRASPLLHNSATILVSPRLRAQETCREAGFATPPPHSEPRAVEWNYGIYEGLTREEIEAKNPGWELFRDGAPQGESPQEVASRADQLLSQWSSQTETLLLFSHSHFLRILTTRWIGAPLTLARHLPLSVASLSILGFEKNNPAILLWNQPAG